MKREHTTMPVPERRSPRPTNTINPDTLSAVLGAVRQRYPCVDGIPFIMGGAAIDFARCTDIDVFFTSSTVASPPLYNGSTAKFGEFFLPEVGRVVQVIVSRHDLFQTLDRMDISVHQWAIDSAGRRFGAATATLPTEPIRLIRNNNGTPERLRKLSRRYGQPVIDRVQPAPPVLHDYYSEGSEPDLT
jgi:hypothetical protein